LILELVLTALLASTPADAADIELRDQHGGSDRVADHRGEVVVVMVVTARRLRNLKGWERDLKKEFGELRFLRVVDVPEDPPVTHEQVAEKLVRRVPEDIAVLIDIERRWARDLELDTLRPNLLLFDRHGKIVARERGRAEPELVDGFATKIRELASAP
jgi:hypothetical protein